MQEYRPGRQNLSFRPDPALQLRNKSHYFTKLAAGFGILTG